MPAELIHARFKGNTRAGRGFLKNHAERLALQTRMRDSVFFFIFELIRQIENGKDLFRRQIQQFE